MKIHYEPDSILRSSCQAVTAINAKTVKLGRAMIRCMQRAQGLGLAAPQVGIAKTLFVTSAPGDHPRIFINPRIIEYSDNQVAIQEGCLSIPAIYYPVERARNVVVEAYNEEGEQFTLQVDGMLARIILHEYDHLQGILFWDLLSPIVRTQLQEQYRSQAAPR